jgi:hypothetical protein
LILTHVYAHTRTRYAGPLTELGYDNAWFVLNADEEEVLQAMDAVGMKKPHRKAVSKAVVALLGTAGGGVAAGSHSLYALASRQAEENTPLDVWLA